MRCFAATLIEWQRHHGRHDLPWQTRDAYRVWLSEIMLQQTQVDTVIPITTRVFLARFPDLPSLAAAPVEDVLALWSGLGYYARARNLHKCAQAVMAQSRRVFPADPAQLAELPGIGAPRRRRSAPSPTARGRRSSTATSSGCWRGLRHRRFPGKHQVENRMWNLADSLLPEARRGYLHPGPDGPGATVAPAAARPAAAARWPTAAWRLRDGGRRSAHPAPEEGGAAASRLFCGNPRQRRGAPRTPPARRHLGWPAEPAGTSRRCRHRRLGAHRYGLEVRRVTPLAGFRHVFTHFTLHLQPEAVEVGAAGRLREAGRRGIRWTAWTPPRCRHRSGANCWNSWCDRICSAFQAWPAEVFSRSVCAASGRRE